MLKQISQTFVRTHRSISRACTVNGEGYKSAYSLEKLYPNSNPDITAPVEQASNTKEPTEEFDGHIPVEKLTVKYSCSSGPGGQNVNKVHTKADVRFHVGSADWLPMHIRQSILEKKSTKISKQGELILTSERTRSQITNFSDCLQKIRDIIEEVQRKPKEPSEKDKAVLRMRVERMNRERLRQKKIHSATKNNRKVLFE
ncbi:peptidyl-tRNA hydrolase ICT1, mitochondrial-like [Acanthaster planci]|uniref:Large ribosomal subunit protein mL62 n=1 Tax=Acanthaster planci TaxID=133434 RepID=A0A8B7XVP8_ACAPL|nr:peptidyl-tRNA hydrolase ICT1, mitochondrial-like [Acanthaster planci]